MQMLDFYKASHPAVFTAAGAAASTASQTLRIMFAASFVTGLEPLLKMCRQWEPTSGGAGTYTRVECTALMFTEESFVADLASLHASHILVRHFLGVILPQTMLKHFNHRVSFKAPHSVYSCHTDCCASQCEKSPTHATPLHRCGF